MEAYLNKYLKKALDSGIKKSELNAELKKFLSTHSHLAQRLSQSHLMGQLSSC